MPIFIKQVLTNFNYVDGLKAIQNHMIQPKTEKPSVCLSIHLYFWSWAPAFLHTLTYVRFFNQHKLTGLHFVKMCGFYKSCPSWRSASAIRLY